MAPDAFSLLSKQGHKQESSAASTYDTFVPNQMPGLERLIELQQRMKTSSPSVDEEKQSPPRANMVNNRDNDVYDKINNAQQTPMNQRQRGNQRADSESYSKTHRVQQIFRKADKP